MVREDEARYFRRLLVNNWQPVSGLTPDDNSLIIHTGEPDTLSDDPQIAIAPATEQPRGESGYDAFQGDGGGFWRRADGMIDIKCVGGEGENIDIKPRWLSSKLAKEVERILHVNSSGVVDEITGEVVYRALAPGQYTGPMSHESMPGRWFSIQEARYTHATPR